MKLKVSEKMIKNNYKNIISVGYCDLWYLLKGQEPKYYTCGIYGWNADIYEINHNTCIVTGYRPFGNYKASYNHITQKYEEQAKKIYNDFEYYSARKRTNKLLEKFIEECIKSS